MIDGTNKPKSPAISLTSPDHIGERPRFLVDTGSQLNIIKQGRLKPTVVIHYDTLYGLTGIGADIVQTVGWTEIKLCHLNVVPDTYPIEWDGILSMEYLKSQNAILSIEDEYLLTRESRPEVIPFVNNESFYLSARTKTLIKVKVANENRKNGYVPRLDVGPGVFVGKCLVKIVTRRLACL